MGYHPQVYLLRLLPPGCQAQGLSGQRAVQLGFFKKKFIVNTGVILSNSSNSNNNNDDDRANPDFLQVSYYPTAVIIIIIIMIMIVQFQIFYNLFTAPRTVSNTYAQVAV